MIDPLDGTNNYSQGYLYLQYLSGCNTGKKPFWGLFMRRISASCIRQSGTEEPGTNGKVIRVAEKQDLAHSVLGTGFPYDKDVNPDNNAANLAAILPSIRGIRRMGSLAYDYAASLPVGWTDIGNWHYSPGICVPEPWLYRKPEASSADSGKTGVFLYWQEMRRSLRKWVKKYNDLI